MFSMSYYAKHACERSNMPLRVQVRQKLGWLGDKLENSYNNSNYSILMEDTPAINSLLKTYLYNPYGTVE